MIAMYSRLSFTRCSKFAITTPVTAEAHAMYNVAGPTATPLRKGDTLMARLPVLCLAVL